MQLKTTSVCIIETALRHGSLFLGIPKAGTKGESFGDKSKCSQKLKKFMLLCSTFRVDFEYHITLN